MGESMTMKPHKVIWSGLSPHWVKFFVLIAVFCLAYWLPLRTMVNIWMTNEDYSYGFLIPVVAGYLIYERRRLLPMIPLKNEWVYLPAFIFFMLFSLYGILGSSGSASLTSIPILILLLTGLNFGTTFLKTYLFPLAFLIFMIPIPDVIERTLGFYLKTISTHLGGWLLRAFNISVHIQGHILDIGVTQLQVVDACSGMRYLFPLGALGVITAYLFERILWKRIVLVVATIPIAILTNSLRVAITGILASHYGIETAEGFFHGFSGWAIFVVAFFFLFLTSRGLKYLPPRSPLSGNRKDVPSSPTITQRTSLLPGFFVSLVLLTGVGGLSLSTVTLPPVALKEGMDRFPLKLNHWTGQPVPFEPEIIAQSGAEDAFNGLYQNSNGEDVSLYIGYRKNAFLENENFFHSPTVCIPATGWQIKKKAVHTIRNVPHWGELKVARLELERMGQEQLVYYWFQTKSRTSYDKEVNRLHLALHALMRDNTYALFIRPIMPIPAGQGIEQAQENMDQFVRDMMEGLMTFLQKNKTME